MYTFPIVVDANETAGMCLHNAVKYRLPGLTFCIEPEDVLHIIPVGYFQLPTGWVDRIESTPDGEHLYLVTTRSSTGKPHTMELVSNIFHADSLAETSDFKRHHGIAKDAPNFILDVDNPPCIEPHNILLIGAEKEDDNARIERVGPGTHGTSYDIIQTDKATDVPRIDISNVDPCGVDTKAYLVINNLRYALTGHWENMITLAREDSRIARAWAFCYHDEALCRRFCTIIISPGEFSQRKRHRY